MIYNICQNSLVNNQIVLLTQQLCCHLETFLSNDEADCYSNESDDSHDDDDGDDGEDAKNYADLEVMALTEDPVFHEAELLARAQLPRA